MDKGDGWRGEVPRPHNQRAGDWGASQVWINIAINCLKLLNIILRQLDGDGNGTVDFPEFLNIIAIKMCEDDSNDDLRQAFNVFDEDGDGFIRYIIYAQFNRLSTKLGVIQYKTQGTLLVAHWFY